MNKQKFSTLLLFCGLFLLGIFVVQKFNYSRTLQINSQLKAAHQNAKHTASKPTHISIGKMVDVAISEEVLEKNMWTISPDSASHLANSAYPKENGNIVIYGHNTPQILGNIRALTGNEIITITTEGGNKHLYKIKSIEEVAPKETYLLKPTKTEVLTLYTCSGLMDRKRFVVQALPFDQQDSISSI